MVTPEQLRELVVTMRELGVVSCCGIVLGPMPTPLQVLQVKADLGDEVAKREAHREAVYQEYRDRLPGWTDAQIEPLIAPEKLDA